MKAKIDYGFGGVIEVERGKQFVIVRTDRTTKTQWSTRSGTIKLADGTRHEAVLEFCDSDSGEHYGTAVWTDMGLFYDDQIPAALGKTAEQVFPYKYRYHGHIHGDHHVAQQF